MSAVCPRKHHSRGKAWPICEGRGVRPAYSSWGEVRLWSCDGAHEEAAGAISHNDSVHRYTKLAWTSTSAADALLVPTQFKSKGRPAIVFSPLRRRLSAQEHGVGASYARMKEAGYLTNETVFSLTELPPRIGVIGAGPIGCEFAQRWPASEPGLPH